MVYCFVFTRPLEVTSERQGSYFSSEYLRLYGEFQYYQSPKAFHLWYSVAVFSAMAIFLFSFFWLPNNLTWKDLQTNDVVQYPRFSDIFVVAAMSVAIGAISNLLQRFLFWIAFNCIFLPKTLCWSLNYIEGSIHFWIRLSQNDSFANLFLLTTFCWLGRNKKDRHTEYDSPIYLSSETHFCGLMHRNRCRCVWKPWD